MTPAEVVQVFSAKRAGKGKWVARCPAHDDRSRNTLSIQEGRKGVLIHCWAGCDKDAVLSAVGLKMNQLFYGSRDMSSAKLKDLYRQQYRDSLYQRERRIMDLQMVLKAVNLKPYQRVKQCKTRFEHDIDRFCCNV